MKVVTILQTLMILAVYLGMTVLLPALIFHQKLKEESLGVRFFAYLTIGNFYIINLVLALQLLHISNRLTLFLFTVFPAWITAVRINRWNVQKSVGYAFRDVRHFLEGTMGFKLLVSRMFRGTLRMLRDLLGLLGESLRKDFFNCMGLAFSLFLVLRMYGFNLLETLGYCMSDLPVHNYWINEMGSNHIFAAGIYPFGFHCVIYYLHTLFGIKTFVLLRVFGMVQTLLVHAVLLTFLKQFSKTKYMPYLAFTLYALAGFWKQDVIMRFCSALPQEFGMTFILPAAVFLMLFFPARKKEKGVKKLWVASTRYLVLFAMSFSLTLAVHFYNTMIIGLFCIGIAAGYAYLLFRRAYFVRIMAAGILSILVAVLPMGIAYASGVPLQGSLQWGLDIIGGASDGETPTPENPEETGQSEETGESGESKETGQTEASEESEKTEETGQTEQTEEPGETGEPGAAGESEETGESGMTRLLASMSEQTGETGEAATEEQTGETGEAAAEEQTGEAATEEQTGETDKADTEEQTEETEETESESESEGLTLGGRGDPHGSVADRLLCAWDALPGMVRANLLEDAPMWLIAPWLVSIPLLGLLGIIFFWLRDNRDYGCMLFSVAVFLLLLFLLLLSPALGIPTLMDANRCSIYLTFAWVIGMTLCIDALFGLVFFVTPNKAAGGRTMNFAALEMVTVITALLIMRDACRKPLFLEGLETNGAIACLTNILHEEENEMFTICSANDEFRMMEEYGYHEEAIKFLRMMEGNGVQKYWTLPTPHVYIFIEKIPGDYMEPYEGSGRTVSEEGASCALPWSAGLSVYKGENRYIVMSRMYYWAQAFQKLYPTEMRVYYETEDFVCYVVEQNPNRLFDLAIDYGFNMQ